MKDLDSIYFAARELPPEDRAAWLAQACGDDGALRARVEQMLAVADQAEAFIADPGTVITPPSEQAGERIGRYKLLQEIGEGGFGTVWMAEQVEPVSRRVALKIIKLGMDTKEVFARFEAERHALAMMDHPNIAKVLDAGATDRGRPYFVMELVKGVPITGYCDEAGLGTRERLALFGDVCSAINHAHQKGIIHRDIKPSNVMVTLYADKPVVKVIDFGIAKATQSKLTDKTLFTRFEQFIGTPVYMSPEQASLSAVDIDTRSDVYGLGILLYELLTGKPPFDAKSLASAGYEEMRRIIREVEPPKPSSRLSTVGGEERTLLAKARHIAPEKLSRLVEPDLDWIVMKAIEKDRTRRYETANGLALDIQRFLADEPVSATPPGAGYRFRKFARRNKAALRVAAGIAAVLVAATAVSTWQAVRATQAETKTAETLKQVAAERDAKELARQDAEAISVFLSEVFQSPDPARDGHKITVAETLEKAVKRLDTDLATQPARRVKLQETLGKTWFALGLALQAVPLQEKVRNYFLATFGPEHPDTLRAMHNLAHSLHEAGRRAEALNMREEVLTLERKVLGPEHPDTLAAMTNLAISYRTAERRGEAFKLQEEVLTLSRKALGPEHTQTIGAIHNLAISFFEAGRKNEALKLREEVLALRRRVNGPEHPDTLRALESLAISCYDAGRIGEALKLRGELLALRRKILPPEHPDTVRALHQMAFSCFSAGRRDEAIRMFEEEVLPLCRKVLGAEDRETLGAMTNLARAYGKTGRLKEAVALQEEALVIERRVLQANDPWVTAALSNLADLYEKTGREEEAAALRKERSAGLTKTFPAVAATLVSPDSEWKWLHPVDGVDPATGHSDFHTTFFTTGFDDSAWKSGKDSADPDGGFGYGPGFTGIDIGLPPDETQRHSAYFRHRFTTDKPHASLELRGQRDDAIIVYLDGKEVLRDNLPAGPDAYLLSATVPQRSDNDGVVHRFPIPGTLAPGEHLLAISVHNTKLPSSDLRLGGVTLVETAEEPKPPR
jgi:tetratricopeptide (TPR) repeat protein